MIDFLGFSSLVKFSQLLIAVGLKPSSSPHSCVGVGVCVRVCTRTRVYIPQHACEGQRTIYNQASLLSIHSVSSRNETWSFVLAASTFATEPSRQLSCFLEGRSLTRSWSSLVRLDRWPASLGAPPASISLVLGLQKHTIMPTFLCGYKGTKSGPHAYTASSSRTEPSSAS